jgi:hypothetical protein
MTAIKLNDKTHKSDKSEHGGKKNEHGGHKTAIRNEGRRLIRSKIMMTSNVIFGPF